MLDLRLPIGWLFLIFGGLLVGFGMFHPIHTICGENIINLNLYWGTVMAIFGLSMALLAFASKSES